jgi:hypothetical protein
MGEQISWPADAERGPWSLHARWWILCNPSRIPPSAFVCSSTSATSQLSGMARCNFVDEDGESCEKKARRSADFPHRCNRHQFDDDEPAELSSPKLKGILKSPPPTPTAPPLENAASRPTTPNSRQSAPWLASVSVDEGKSAPLTSSST